jgi:hypothetical protein
LQKNGRDSKGEFGAMSTNQSFDFVESDTTCLTYKLYPHAALRQRNAFTGVDAHLNSALSIT